MIEVSEPTTALHAGILVVVAVTFAGCRHYSDSTEPPEQETSTVSIAFDGETEEANGVVHDDLGEITLVGRLASPNGRRSLVLIDSEVETTIEEPNWVFPPVAAVDGRRNVLACWNTLSGEVTDHGEPPSPTEGLALICRARLNGEWTSPTILGTGQVASWLQNIDVLGEKRFRVRFYSDPTGALVSPREAGGGLFQVEFNERAFGEPMPQ